MNEDDPKYRSSSIDREEFEYLVNKLKIPSKDSDCIRYSDDMSVSDFTRMYTKYRISHDPKSVFNELYPHDFNRITNYLENRL